MPGALAMCAALFSGAALAVVLLARRHQAVAAVRPLRLYSHVYYRPPRG